MKYIYINNFRGFKNTFVPIKDVNFLVGENSTGKTSILSLIFLLSNPKFWLSQGFNTNEVQLGTFKDIVSINSENKDYFEIGFFECKDNVKKNDLNKVSAYFMRFIQHEGSPMFSCYNYLQGDNEIHVYCKNKDVFFKTKSINFKKDIYSHAFKIFVNWTKEKNSRNNYRKLKNLKLFSTNDLLFIAPNLINQEVAKNKKSKKYSFSFMRSVFTNVEWIGPIRTRPKRTYDPYNFNLEDEEDESTYVIKKILSSKQKTYNFLKFIKQFGGNSGLFKSISIRNFGNALDSPFELDVILNKKPLNITNVGYGISQSLPVAVEMFSKSKNTAFAIQQPEIHLHPKAQAAIGDLINFYAFNENKKFYIETHSDYMIDRFRVNLRDNKQKMKIESQVLFFERTTKGNQVFSIGIEKDGKYSDKQPKSFRDFFIKEQLALLNLP